jgi:hypothetical protein
MLNPNVNERRLRREVEGLLSELWICQGNIKFWCFANGEGGFYFLCLIFVL